MDRNVSTFTVLFVCTGNTCRSPMAELIFNSLTSDTDFKGVSAGLYAFDGSAMSENSLYVLGEIGIDGSSFRSQSTTHDLVEGSSLILTMTHSQRNELIMRFPDAAEKCRTIMEFSGGGDVSDPYGGDLNIYRNTMAEIRQGIDGWMNVIKTLNKTTF